MKSIEAIIDKQIGLNKGANFFNEKALLKLSEEVLQIGKIDGDQIDGYIAYAVNKVLEEFYRVNQYYYFDKQAKHELELIYKNWYAAFCEKSIPSDEIAARHSRNLKDWLRASNPFSEKMYSSKGSSVEPVSCFEYEPELQVDILQIDLEKIIEPVLDVGCGQQASFVQYLRKKGFEAFGIDRFPSAYPYVEDSDWLEYDYGVNRWGTIISNLGFSNHFAHHHIREDGNYIAYATKYMQILNSLKRGGSFHYAPGMPFIEKYLDAGSYRMTTKTLSDEEDYKSAVVKRII